MGLKLPQSYQPSDEEPFMNPLQVEYFRHRLLAWREELLRESNETISNLQGETQAESDLIDCAANETDRTIELRARDRSRRLLIKIAEALKRIEEGTYGYCDATGEEIGIKRLEARPIATLSLEAQEHHERRERLQREVG
jgi:DnaK suppressor protein